MTTDILRCETLDVFPECRVAFDGTVLVCRDGYQTHMGNREMDEPRQSFPAVRRIVTGHDETGKAVVLMDGEAANTRSPDPDTKSTILWITDASPTAFTGDEDGANLKSGFAPPPQGSRFGILDIAPGNRRFMHRTDTVDYVICLKGPVQLELDDSEVTVQQGDIVVQRGTNHAWKNRGEQDARIAFVLLDALLKREGSL